MSRRGTILGLVVLAQMSSALLSQGLPTLFAFLQADFGLSRAEVGLFVSSIQAGMVLTFVLGGWAADAIGVRRVLPIAQIVVGIVGLIFSQVGSFPQGLAVLAVSGVAVGMANPCLSIAILAWFPVRGRGTAMGVKQTGVPIAGILSAVLLPSIALFAGWRACVMALSLVTIAVALLFLLVYREPPDARPVAVMRRPTWSQVLALLRYRELVLASIYAAVLIADQFVLVGYLILYLRDHLGMAIVVGGLMLALAQAGAFVGRIAWGVFSDVVLHGRRVPGLALAGAVAAVLLALLAALPRDPPLWLLAVLAFGLGFSAIGWHGLRQALVPELVPRSLAGMALGVGQTMAETGPILGPPLFGAMADIAGYRPAWLLMAVLTAGVSFMLWRGLDEVSVRERLRAAEPAVAVRPVDEPQPGAART